MTKLPRFLKVTNPLAAPGREFIVHTRAPAWLAEVHTFNNLPDALEAETSFQADADAKELPALGCRTTTFEGEIAVIFVIKLFETFEKSQKETDRIARILRRMADWYRYTSKKHIK